MLGKSPENTKAAHLAVSGDPKQQEDVKLYGQLPDYDDFQCYDLGRVYILHQVAQGIYADFRKHSWSNLKRRLFSVKTPQKNISGFKTDC